MKKQLLSGLLLSMTALATQAQVTMENHVPPFGTTYSMSSVTGLTAASKGASQTWNYASVTATGIASYSIVNPTSLPAKIKDSVPTATYGAKLEIGAPTPDLAPYDFIENKTTYYLKVGVKSSGSNPVEKRQDTIMMFGQSFGTTQWYGGKSYTYSGYGTLTVKTKTYTNVVLLSIGVPGSSDSAFQFFQFAPHFQLLLSYAVIGGNIQNGLYWEPTGSASGVEEKESTSCTIFPNPASTSVTLNLSENTDLKEAFVYSISGQLLKTFELYSATRQHQLSIDDLDKGIYLLKAGSHTQKLIVE